MKKILTAVLSLLLTFSLALPCFANGYKPDVVSVTEDVLNNGVVCTTTIYEYPFVLRSNTRQGSVVQEYKYSGKTIAYVSLNATFTYDGATATAVSASGDHSVSSGWSYSGQSTWCSGASAHLTATVSGDVTFPVSLTLTCSPSGVLS